MRTERISELKAAVAATPLSNLLPMRRLWFLRALERHPIPTVLVVTAGLLAVRFMLRPDGVKHRG